MKHIKCLPGKFICFLFLIFCFSFPGFSQTFYITTFAGISSGGFYGDGGQATSAEINFPQNIFLTGAPGDVYIADAWNNRIRLVNTGGIISTIAGNGTAGYSGDGGQATNAEFYWAYGVAADDSGNVYVGDWLNYRIRKINTNGIISTIAGNGVAGDYGDGGPATAAEIHEASSIFVDNATGNVYFTDDDNNKVRMINTSGTMINIAGTGTAAYSGDGGPATAAQLNWPSEVTMDIGGSIIISDEYNNRIRKITGGIITTIAGNGFKGFSGDGGPATAAELNWPTGVAANKLLEVIYIDDYENNRIRIINVSGDMQTIAGNGTAGYSGDGGPATAAELNGPVGIQVDPTGVVYFADLNNNRIRRLVPGTSGIDDINSTGSSVSVFPNPSTGKFFLQVESEKASVKSIEVFNVLGEKVYSKSYQPLANSNQVETIDLSNLPNGIYLYRVISENGTLLGNDKIIIEK